MGAGVPPVALPDARVEGLLEGEVRGGPDRIGDGSPEAPERRDDLLACLHFPGVADDEVQDELAVQLLREVRDRWDAEEEGVA